MGLDNMINEILKMSDEVDHRQERESYQGCPIFDFDLKRNPTIKEQFLIDKIKRQVSKEDMIIHVRNYN